MKDESHIDLETLAIEKVPIGCLTKAYQGEDIAFRIPAYQRGYRWKTEDVTKLLQDLQDFVSHDQDGRSFYCLQPLVVKKARVTSDDETTEQEVWEVVDGQQRLTTIFLIWNVLNGTPPYGLSYETRKRSEDFLNEPKPDNSGRFPNIDFHHIYHAYQAIQTRLKDDEDLKNCLKNLLVDTNSEGRNVRFIWYRLQEDDDAVAAFTRLNVGKIQLTDEELIRALFLSSREAGELADGAFQHRLALDWDRIEIALQEPDFWGFLSNEIPPEGGRIRLLFRLCAPTDLKNQNHALFDYYHVRLTGEHPEKPSSVWHEIIACFEQLEEWYRDPELYHLVGYRTTVLNRNKRPTGILRELLQEAKDSSKQDFARNLRVKIRAELITGGKTLSDFIDELDYLRNSGPIRPTLALFNIATILRTEGVRIRFPFHLYHDTKNGWDIEHVQSRAGDRLGDKPRQKKWLEACRPELEQEARLPSGQEDGGNPRKDERAKSSPGDLLAAIDEFEKEDSKTDFPDLEKKIRSYFNEEDVPVDLVDSIGNLTLLDAPTNRGYGNAPFVVKRAEILKPERPDGTFILPCTRDLFLKVFSKNPGNLRRWNIEHDGAAHEAAICKTLERFFGEEGGSPR